MNLFGIYLLEMAQGFYVGVAVVCFLPLIVTVPYDFLFRRERIRANWQDMKNVFGWLLAGKNPQVQKKKEPPSWNVWFKRQDRTYSDRLTPNWICPHWMGPDCG